MTKPPTDNGLIDFGDLGGLDPAISSVLGNIQRQELPPEERKKARKADQKKAAAKKKMAARLPNRATYDLPEGMKARIEQIAKEEDTTASQVAGFLLAHALELLAQGEIDFFEHKIPARSPHYSWKLETPFDWKEKKPRSGK